MCRKHLALIFATILLISVLGCGIKSILPSKEVPPLGDYSTVVLVPFDVKKPSGQYDGLPTKLSYAIGTKLSIRHQGRNWLYDQTARISPVSDKLKELNISPADVYQDPQKAAQLAESLQADLVIIGQIEEPRLTKKESGHVYEDKSEATPSPAGSRFYGIDQTAVLRGNAKLVTKASRVIWDGVIIGYKKYHTRYRTGNPPRFERDETMMADVRREFVEVLVNKIYPAEVAEEK